MVLFHTLPSGHTPVQAPQEILTPEHPGGAELLQVPLILLPLKDKGTVSHGNYLHSEVFVWCASHLLQETKELIIHHRSVEKSCRKDFHQYFHQFLLLPSRQPKILVRARKTVIFLEDDSNGIILKEGA